MPIVTYGLGQNGDTVDFPVVFGFGILPLFSIDQPVIYRYIVAEELRFNAIHRYDRILDIEDVNRLDLVHFENRIIKIDDGEN